jgi:hypothetical protein
MNKRTAIERRPPINICMCVRGDSIICTHARAQYTIALVVQICAYVHLILCPSKNVHIHIEEEEKKKPENIKEKQDKKPCSIHY